VSNNTVSGCLYVDGVADGNCGFIDDEIPPDGNWAQATSSHHKGGVGFGNHTVQTFIFASLAAKSPTSTSTIESTSRNWQEEHTQP